MYVCTCRLTGEPEMKQVAENASIIAVQLFSIHTEHAAPSPILVNQYTWKNYRNKQLTCVPLHLLRLLRRFPTKITSCFLVFGGPIYVFYRAAISGCPSDAVVTLLRTPLLTDLRGLSALFLPHCFACCATSALDGENVTIIDPLLAFCAPFT